MNGLMTYIIYDIGYRPTYYPRRFSRVICECIPKRSYIIPDILGFLSYKVYLFEVSLLIESRMKPGYLPTYALHLGMYLGTCRDLHLVLVALDII